MCAKSTSLQWDTLSIRCNVKWPVISQIFDTEIIVFKILEQLSSSSYPYGQIENILNKPYSVEENSILTLLRHVIFISINRNRMVKIHSQKIIDIMMLSKFNLRELFLSHDCVNIWYYNNYETWPSTYIIMALVVCTFTIIVQTSNYVSYISFL